MEWTFDGQLYVSPRDADAVLGNDRVSSELVGRRASHVQQSLGHVTTPKPRSRDQTLVT